MKNLFRSFVLCFSVTFPGMLSAEVRLEATVIDCSFRDLSVTSSDNTSTRQLAVLFDRYQNDGQQTYRLEVKDPTGLLIMGNLRYFDFRLDEKRKTPIFSIRSDERSQRSYLLFVSSRTPRKFEKMGSTELEIFSGFLGDTNSKQPPLSGWCTDLHGDGALKYFNGISSKKTKLK